MDLTKPKRLMTSPYWPMVLVAVGLLILAYSRRQTMEPSNRLDRREFITFSVMGCMFLIEGLKHYSIHPSGIMVHFLLFPVRWITWDKVANAQYIQSWTSDGRKMTKKNGHRIVVTLLDCAYFDPETDGLEKFLIKHPIGALSLRFTAKNKDRYIEIFSRYCELEFQSGTMSNES